MLTLLCLLAFSVVVEALCGCGEQGKCQVCCGRKHTRYSKVWEADFSKRQKFRSQFEVLTTDPLGDQGSSFVDDGTTVTVENRQMHITVREQENVTSGPRYHTGRVQSKASFTYGLFVVETASIPEGCGLWPKIRLLPGPNGRYGTWPHSGEIDVMETTAVLTNPGFVTSSIQYGSCGRGTLERDSYCRLRSQNLPNSTDGRTNGSIYAMEWTHSSIRYFHWDKGSEPSSLNHDHPDSTSWEPYGVFHRAGHDEAPRPEAPYEQADVQKVMGFVCPLIEAKDDKSHYDKRCVVGDEFCPGTDHFQGRTGGGGCDFDAPFGPRVCDQKGMHLSFDVKVCGEWPENFQPGKTCCAHPNKGYPDLSGLDGKAMSFSKVRVFQLDHSETTYLCCPRKSASPFELQSVVERICRDIDCSPIEPGGLYFNGTSNSYAMASWLFPYVSELEHESGCHGEIIHLAETVEGFSSCPGMISPYFPPSSLTKQPTKTPTTKTPTTKTPTTKTPTTKTKAPTKTPTTKTPTTKAPTKTIPTTKAPTTKAPTKKTPTTKAPTTKAPTKTTPKTKAPTTKAPTKTKPTTKAPTTKAPTTKAPTTKAPTHPTKPTTSSAPTTAPTKPSAATSGLPSWELEAIITGSLAGALGLAVATYCLCRTRRPAYQPEAYRPI